MSEKELQAFIGSIKTRAMVYFDIFDALAKSVGDEKATEIMKEGIYKRGIAHSKRYSKEAKNGNMDALAKDFMDGGINSLFVFGHEVVTIDKNSAVFRLNRCELVNAWKENDLDEKQIVKMCDIAYAVDFGKFETLGCKLEFSKRISKGDAYCELIISRNKE